MCCQVNVTKGTLSQAEIDAYVDHARQKYNREPLSMDIAVDGDEVELSYDFGNVPFQRIRRITGYLVGTLDRFNNAYPHRKPVNRPMWVLMFVMVGIVIFADVTYLNAIYYAISRPDNPIAVTMSTIYIAYAEYYLRTHIMILAAGAVLTLLLPVYSKWIRKIKTSVEVEDNGNLGAIDISGEN